MSITCMIEEEHKRKQILEEQAANISKFAEWQWALDDKVILSDGRTGTIFLLPTTTESCYKIRLDDAYWAPHETRFVFVERSYIVPKYSEYCVQDIIKLQQVRDLLEQASVLIRRVGNAPCENRRLGRDAMYLSNLFAKATTRVHTACWEAKRKY